MCARKGMGDPSATVCSLPAGRRDTWIPWATKVFCIVHTRGLHVSQNALLPEKVAAVKLEELCIVSIGCPVVDCAYKGTHVSASCTALWNGSHATYPL